MSDPLNDLQLPAGQVESIRRAIGAEARRVLRSYSRRAVAGFVILLVAIGAVERIDSSRGDSSRSAVVQSGRFVSVESCNRSYDQTQLLLGLLTSAEASTRQQHSRGKLTDDQFKEAQDFYAEQIKRIKLPDCRSVLKALTDDPSKLSRIPAPKHPPTPKG